MCELKQITLPRQDSRVTRVYTIALITEDTGNATEYEADHNANSK